MQAKGAWAVPDRYEHFETIFVPERDRKDPGYTGYAVGISFEEASIHFDVVEEPIQPPETTRGNGT